MELSLEPAGDIQERFNDPVKYEVLRFLVSYETGERKNNTRRIARLESLFDDLSVRVHNNKLEHTKDIESLWNEIREIRKELAGTSHLGGLARPIQVKDFDETTIRHYKTRLLRLIKEKGQLDPYEFAETEDIDIDLSLICFDELIDEGAIRYG